MASDEESLGTGYTMCKRERSHDTKLQSAWSLVPSTIKSCMRSGNQAGLYSRFYASQG